MNGGMLGWMNAILHGLASVVIGGLALVGVGAHATLAQQGTSTPAVIEVQATTSDMVLCNGQYWNKCPEGQLLVCPTNTTIDAYCSTPKIPKSQASLQASTQKPSSTSTSQVTDNSNYSANIQLLLEAEIKSFNELHDWLASSETIFDSRTSHLNQLVENVQSIPTNGDATNQQIGQVFINAYNSDINQTLKYKNDVSNLIGKVDSDINNLQITYNADVNKSATNADFLQMINSLTPYDTDWQSIDDSAKQSINDFNSYADSQDNQYQQALNYLESKVVQFQASATLSNTYIPPVIYVPEPVIQTPQTTRCTISGDGGVGLEAYVNCTTY